MQNCVLFVGSSFEDPRLIEMDDHVIGLFGSFRRSPVIVLKTPAKKDEQPVAEFDAENADFEDRKAEIEERGFVVITVDAYQKVPQLLRQLRDKILEGKKAEGGAIQNNAILLSLQSDRYEDLREEFTRFLDADTKELIRSIKGGGSIPSLSRIRAPVEALVARLDRPPHDLSDETKVEAYLALFESFVATGKTEDLRRAREFYGKANAALADLHDKQKWSDRLGLTKARLLYLEGQLAEAIAILDQIPGPKSTTLRLAFLLGEGRPQEVLELVKRHEKTEKEWIPFVLPALIETGQPQEAEELFEKTKTDVVGAESRGLLEKLYFHMASAFFHRAHRLEGKPHVMNMLASPLSQEAQAACMKARYYAEGLFRSIDLIDLNESLIAALTKAVEMNAAFFTRDFAQADQAARQLLTYRPILREVAEHVVFREASFEKDELSRLVENLMHDHPEAFWAWRICALLEGFRLEHRQESWEAVTKAAALASGEQERQDAARMAVELGRVLGRDDHAKEIADSLLDESSAVRKFLRGCAKITSHSCRSQGVVPTGQSFVGCKHKVCHL